MMTGPKKPLVRDRFSCPCGGETSTRLSGGSTASHTPISTGSTPSFGSSKPVSINLPIITWSRFCFINDHRHPNLCCRCSRQYYQLHFWNYQSYESTAATYQQAVPEAVEAADIPVLALVPVLVAHVLVQVVVVSIEYNR